VNGGHAVERRARLRMCAALAARDQGALAASMRGLRGARDSAAVEEALLQSYLFVGYPAAMNALALWREISGRAAPEPTEEDWALWSGRGAEVLRRVYGGQYDGVRATARAMHPDMERWMVEEGYGKVLGRPGLELPERELCIIALLTVLDAPRQLYSHLRGARNVGAADADVEDALAEARPFTTEAAWERAQEAWSRVRARSVGAAS
jgi:4-carboxymuconolactone decarboxylase